MAKTRRNFYLDDDVYNEFKRWAAINGHSVGSVVEHCMKEYNSIMRMTLSGVSAQDLLDYKVCKVKMELDQVASDENSKE